ncbi:hypothetical protein FDP41_011498 [Naegleria fowleri]|uniref:CHCH domain-containing protein n=1 Tax=Naegleria fowleri TaxID=5763 RepID=A0A6A5CA78_NAEFO|nr:uncharacterized protein FDP41_011498 [Naegleria fowleri]KAF0982568.1 hypothetical protein FDP41_011498 [Naegleria fowleri]
MSPKPFDEEESSDLDTIIEGLGACAKQYWEMDKCLEAHNHSWSACQAFVLNLKKCYNELEQKGLRSVQNDRAIQAEIQRLKLAKKKKEMEKKVITEKNNE